MIAEQYKLYDQLGEIAGWRKKVVIIREEYSLASSCSWVQKINSCRSLWFSFPGYTSPYLPQMQSLILAFCSVFPFLILRVLYDMVTKLVSLF